MEGLVAPEAANNAAIGGAFIPMLTLGIPGDSVTAILIGALTIQGLQPGPLLLTNTPNLFYFIVGSLVLANIFLLLFGLTGIRIFAKIVEIPKGILMPAIVILSVIGVYSLNNSLYDIFWMVGFGVLGYFLKRYDFPVAPAVLGIILASLLEKNFRRAVIMHGSMAGILKALFTSPISLILLAVIVFMLLSQRKRVLAVEEELEEEALEEEILYEKAAEASGMAEDPEKEEKES